MCGNCNVVLNAKLNDSYASVLLIKISWRFLNNYEWTIEISYPMNSVAKFISSNYIFYYKIVCFSYLILSEKNCFCVIFLLMFKCFFFCEEFLFVLFALTCVQIDLRRRPRPRRRSPGVVDSFIHCKSSISFFIVKYWCLEVIVREPRHWLAGRRGRNLL